MLLYRDDEARLELVEQGRPWSFDGDGAIFRLVAEAQRFAELALPERRPWMKCFRIRARHD
ncbi:MAG: hypothetical protein U0X20_24905 [Caldilineaceae bacterium]